MRFWMALVLPTLMFASVARATANEPAASTEDRLTATLAEAKATQLSPGVHSLNLEAGRDGYLYIPSGYRANVPAPFLLFLHGNNGDRNKALALFRALADKNGFILLVPESRKRTWDRIIDKTFGPDLAYIDRALKFAFASTNIDSKHVGIAGFSDGASYALGLGQTNGDLFTHIAAFSPGGSSPGVLVGRPPVFVIHGVQDDVLNIDECSRKIVPALKEAGYSVEYHEFQGQHLVTPEGKALMAMWFSK